MADEEKEKQEIELDDDPTGSEKFDAVMEGTKQDTTEEPEEKEEPLEAKEEPEEIRDEGGNSQEEDKGGEDTEEPKEFTPEEFDRLRKENKGYYKEFSKQRERATKAEEKIAKLEGKLSVVNDFLVKAAGKEEKPDTGTPDVEEEQMPEVSNIKFDLDDDGNLIADAKMIANAVKKELGITGTPTKKELDEIKVNTLKIQQEFENQKRMQKFGANIKDFVSKDEAYPKAMNALMQSADYLAKTITGMIQNEGKQIKDVPVPMMIHMLANDPEVIKVMDEKYNGAPIDRVLQTALGLQSGNYDPYNLKRVLDRFKPVKSSAATDTPEEKKETFKTLTQKASNLAGVRTQVKNDKDDNLRSLVGDNYEKFYTNLIDMEPKKAKELLAKVKAMDLSE